VESRYGTKKQQTLNPSKIAKKEKNNIWNWFKPDLPTPLFY